MSKKYIVMCICLFSLLSADKLDDYLAKHKWEKSEKFCAKQRGQSRINSYMRLANSYIEIGLHTRAAVCYKEAGKPELAEAIRQKIVVRQQPLINTYSAIVQKYIDAYRTKRHAQLAIRAGEYYSKIADYYSLIDEIPQKKDYYNKAISILQEAEQIENNPKLKAMLVTGIEQYQSAIK